MYIYVCMYAYVCCIHAHMYVYTMYMYVCMYVCHSQLIPDNLHISQFYYVILEVNVLHFDIHDTGQTTIDQRKVNMGVEPETDHLVNL